MVGRRDLDHPGPRRQGGPKASSTSPAPTSKEDAGKSLHEDFHGMTGIDLNRAGTPLLEIVSEPDMRSVRRGRGLRQALHALVRWIDICDGNMQEGSFRCDANVSVRPAARPKFGTRREIKNLNSFRFLQQAIDYEVQWQIDLIEDGGKVQQATVLFDPDTGETRAMRSKEDAHDYRYFPDPDLLPLVIDTAWVERLGRMCSTSWATAQQVKSLNLSTGLSKEDAVALTPFPRVPHVLSSTTRGTTLAKPFEIRPNLRQTGSSTSTCLAGTGVQALP